MSRRSRLLRLFPPAWRERYGEEFDALLEDLGPVSPRMWLDVLIAALRLRIRAAAARRARLASGIAGTTTNGGAGILVRPFFVLAVIAAIVAVGLFLLHSFAYALLALFALLFALASGTAKLLDVRRHAPR